MKFAKGFMQRALICLLLAGGMLSPAQSQPASFYPNSNITIHTSDWLNISCWPNWNYPGICATAYAFKDSEGDRLVLTQIYPPDSYSTSLSPNITPAGDYEHVVEYCPFQFYSVEFTLTRSSSVPPSGPTP